MDDFKKTSSIPLSIVKTILKIEITDVYKGAKYEDTCIHLSTFTLKKKDGFIMLEHPDGEIQLFEGMR